MLGTNAMMSARRAGQCAGWQSDHFPGALRHEHLVGDEVSSPSVPHSEPSMARA